MFKQSIIILSFLSYFLSCFLLEKVDAFSLQGGVQLNQTGRWDKNAYKNRGLAGTLQWNLETDFLNKLTFAETKVTKAQLTKAIKSAFGTWEKAAKDDPLISDLVRFNQGGEAVEADPADGSGVGGEKDYQGTEISLFARPQNAKVLRQKDRPENIFGENEAGHTSITDWTKRPVSTATNKEHNVGVTFVDADIYINSSVTWTLKPDENLQAQDFITILIHEIGHALGLAHPDGDPYFDTDNDPNNRMTINALAPENTPGLIEKPNPQPSKFTPLPVMISDSNIRNLAQDDLSGLNYLYPECPQSLLPKSQRRSSTQANGQGPTCQLCKPCPVSESSSALGILAFGTLGLSSVLFRKKPSELLVGESDRSHRLDEQPRYR